MCLLNARRLNGKPPISHLRKVQKPVFVAMDINSMHENIYLVALLFADITSYYKLQ